MKTYFSIQEFGLRKNLVVTVGTFDGLHLGHTYILKELVASAKKIKGESALLTFYPHPRMVLFPNNNELKMLNSQEEKIELLDKMGLDHLIIHPFSKSFSRLNSVEFVRDILVNKLGVKKLIIGYDHHFGRNREGTFQDLIELANLYDFEVERIEAQDFESTRVSSTKIRKSIEDGNMKRAKEFLGYSYFITGRVVKGAGLGREIGFKTANLELDFLHKLIPPNGVYAVRVEIDNERFIGMLNIGVRPSVVENGERSIEVYIFEFDQNLYNKTVRLYFIEKIREECKFGNIELLKKQLELDKSKCEIILA